MASIGIILGILMIIAIPSVTQYIQNSRKEAYVKTAKSFSRSVMQEVNERKNLSFMTLQLLILYQ